jgi:prevent-host-death family protein
MSSRSLDQPPWPSVISPVTIHVNSGEAKTRLSELLAAALRGEEVVLQKAGVPVATIVPKPKAQAIEREARAAKRKAAIGFAREKYAHLPPEAFDIPPSMTDEEY